MRKSWMLVASASFTLAALVAACGGGGGSSPSYRLSGVAATGAAVANATVTVQCAAGSPTTTTTAANGSYTVDVSNGTPPCLVTVTQGSLVMRSVTTTGTANVTPLTEALVTSIAAAKGVSNVALLVTPGTAGTVSASDLVNAQVALRAVIQQATGVTVPANIDLITGPLVPPSGTTAGNAYDQALDALKAQNVITTTGTLTPAVQTQVNSSTSETVKPSGTGA